MKSYTELKKRIETCGVHAQLGPVGQGWGIEQNPHELATFLVRMQELGVQSVLEIGTGYKAGLARFLAHEMDWDVMTVDIQDYGHHDEKIGFLVEKNPRYMHFCTSEHDTSPKQFDLVFIDGAHDYANVKADYEHWGRFAGKAIAFHDIDGLRDCAGARDFWDQLWTMDGLTRHINDPLTHFSVIADSDQRAGIGWMEL